LTFGAIALGLLDCHFSASLSKGRARRVGFHEKLGFQLLIIDRANVTRGRRCSNAQAHARHFIAGSRKPGAPHGGLLLRRYVLAIAVAALFVIGAAALFILPISASRVVSTIRIHREIADVFDFFTTPGNWPRWHPASISVAGATDHSLEVREEVTEEIRAGSRKARAVWRVNARDAPHLWRIEGTPASAAGDAGVTITYRLRMDGRDTVFERDMQYQFNRRWLALLDPLFHAAPDGA
jgi:uncharacterized protein YndB with AHSA1/START domain